MTSARHHLRTAGHAGRPALDRLRADPAGPPEPALRLALSDGHLYREQKRLADLGWATVEQEPAGLRSRNRYAITPRGVRPGDWFATEPEEPHFQIEGILRIFLG